MHWTDGAALSDFARSAVPLIRSPKETSMNLTQNLVLVAIIALFAVLEVASGRHKNFKATADDTKLEAFMFIALIAISQPLIFKVTGMLGSWLMPEQKGAWSALPWWAMAAILLVGDDLTQYRWHRASHTPLLWPLHRAHHSAHYMSIRITYRNNFFYYLMMPGLWISGVLIYLGFGTVYLVYIVVKLAVILGAHSAVRWDEPLYRIKALAPLAWLVERTISTPATHWGASRPDQQRRHRPLHGQLRQSAVLLGRAVRHRQDHASLPGGGRPARRPDARQGALVRRDVLSARAVTAHALRARPGWASLRRRRPRRGRRRRGGIAPSQRHPAEPGRDDAGGEQHRGRMNADGGHGPGQRA